MISRLIGTNKWSSSIFEGLQNVPGDMDIGNVRFV